jgi:hypothetical protein
VADGVFGYTANGGAIFVADGFADISDTSFLVPANTSNGHNDLLAGGKVVFFCPPGTKGTPVTVPEGPRVVQQLPPSTEIVHCTTSQYICIHGGTPSAKCVLGVPGLSLEKCQQACLP